MHILFGKAGDAVSLTFSVFGNDQRQTYLFEQLMRDGISVVHTNDTIRLADVVILPTPSFTEDGLVRGTTFSFLNLMDAAPSGTVFWGTGFARFRSAPAAARHILLDFNNFSSFAERNAIPTAEGAIQIAMQEMPTTISGGQFLVIGYGRIGKYLSDLLASLGGIVTVSRQEPSPIPYRCDTTGDYTFPLCTYDAIFNTVPKSVFTAEHCMLTKPDCLLVDLASAPGGIASTADRKLIHALGLPAKVAPKTAAEIMHSIILKETEASLWKTSQSDSQ